MKLSATLILILVIVMFGHARHFHSRHLARKFEYYPENEIGLEEETPVSYVFIIIQVHLSVSIEHKQKGIEELLWDSTYSWFNAYLLSIIHRKQTCVKDEKTQWVYYPVKLYQQQRLEQVKYIFTSYSADSDLDSSFSSCPYSKLVGVGTILEIIIRQFSFYK